jgi:hypothetical protein
MLDKIPSDPQEAERYCTQQLLRPFIPDSFLREHSGDYDLIFESRSDVPSPAWENWPRFLLERHGSLPIRDVFCPNNYGGGWYFLPYLFDIVRLGGIRDVLSYSPSDVFLESYWKRFPWLKLCRRRLDTIKEGLYISSFCSTSRDFLILEIGGGYGRLAEYFLQKFPLCHYVLIDAFPISVLSSEYYIKSFVSDDELCFLNQSGRLDLSDPAALFRYRAIWLPPNRIRDVAHGHVSVAVNVHSMDEMADSAIAYYLDAINEMDPEYVFLKNHFRHYVPGILGSDDSEWWDGLIPQSWNAWRNAIAIEEIPLTLRLSNRMPQLGYVRGVKVTYERTYSVRGSDTGFLTT